MATLTNGYVNGHTNGVSGNTALISKRFSDIPSAIDIPVSGVDEEAVELDLVELHDDPTELCTLLDNENASKSLWLTISLAYAKQHNLDLAIEIVNRGLQSLTRAGQQKEKIGLLSLQCWLYLWKSREAPRVAPEGELISEAKTKDFYLQAATGVLNEASRVNPSFPPLVLAKGVLSLLRASLQSSGASTAPGAVEQSERAETLRQASKCFEDASRVSGGRNMMAILGKARTQFAQRKYEEALVSYQDVLSKMPDLHDPDPRIGIGCCLWQLNHITEAKDAWQRALDINPNSSIANTLIGLYYFHDAQKHAIDEDDFLRRYEKTIKTYAQRALGAAKKNPLACSTLAAYFYTHQVYDMVEKMARKAIELTDTNAIASDAWYNLARKEHDVDAPDWNRVEDFYNRADSARGGGDKGGFLPARFGSIQAGILAGKKNDAKFRLEKIVQHHNSSEAKILLGNLYAQEVFVNQASGLKEDKSAEQKKAIAFLDTVRIAWKDPKRALEPDLNVLLTLARLYEAEQPEKALQCLLQAEQITINDLDDDEKYLEIEDERERKQRQAAHLPPPLLNNIGCFQFQLDRFEAAAETFQLALGGCMNDPSEDSVDSDQLVTTISYNLGRSYEASHLLDEAKGVYESLLVRHPDYVDAQSRIAYIELRQNPSEEGPKAIGALYETDAQDMEIRSLYGWYLNKAKRRTQNIAEDQEQRHYKHTLQQFDKHDHYALTAMGNLYLMVAREMRRETEQDKEKRRKTYERAVEFFHKALQLDLRNAYAAQGIAIALAEDKKDFQGAVQIFSKIKDTIKESCVLINLGHAFGEQKLWDKAIESYEAAINKDRAHDPQLLACLGRVWCHKGRAEKSIDALKSALDYSRKALEIAPDLIYFQFNIAYVQIQMAQIVHALSEQKRSLADVEAAITGLDEAIQSFTEISAAKNPPYPRHDLEQRANMGKNTIRKQLDRALQAQRDYEEANATKIAENKRAREAELRKREEKERQEAEEEAQRKRKLQEDRERLLAESRKLAEKRTEENRRLEEAEYTEDSDGNRVKRKARRAATKRKKKGADEDDGFISDDALSGLDAAPARGRRGKHGSDAEEGNESGSRAPQKKKRKLARKSEAKTNSKYKSAEMVYDSDEENMDANSSTPVNGRKRDAFDLSDEEEEARPVNTQENGDRDGDIEMNDAGDEDDLDEDEGDAVVAPRKKTTRTIADDDDEEDEEDKEEAQANAFAEPPISMVNPTISAGNPNGPRSGLDFEADQDSTLANS